MTDADILNDIKTLAIDVFDIDDVEMTPQTKAADIPEWDSLSHIRLMVAIERKYGIRFASAEVEGLRDVGELVAAIRSKVA